MHVRGGFTDPGPSSWLCGGFDSARSQTEVRLAAKDVRLEWTGEEMNRAPVCARCGGELSQFARLSAEERGKVGAQHRATGTIRTIGLLRDLGVMMQSAKAIAQHLTLTPGQCHRCKEPLAGSSDYVVCPKCQSLNFDW
jgi:hypothetical protein